MTRRTVRGKMGHGWIDVSASPIANGIMPGSVILVWHIFQGVMAVPCEKWNENRFYTHWRTIDNNAWIRTEDRLPKRADADILNCVISRDGLGEIRLTGWHRFLTESGFNEWQTPPEPPDGYQELRKNAL